MKRQQHRFLAGCCAVVFLVLVASNSHAQGADSKPSVEKDGDMLWYDIKSLGVEGQGWKDTAAPFDRFPARAKQTVRPAVWNLSRNSAGLCVRFVTDATTIHAKWNLTSSRLAMTHMPATGVSGLDLYAKDDAGKFRWVACGFPKAQETNIALISGLPEGSREYCLYLPLYNGVKSVRIGTSNTAKLEAAPVRSETQKPIVFYGTSITQGGCASRPGMVHTSILGRWLNRPVINLGFSGNGEMEAEVGALIAELDSAAIVIDCLPNMNAKEVAERTAPLVALLRKAKPNVPIILVEDRNYTNSWLLAGKRNVNTKNQVALRHAFEQLRSTDKNLHYLSGDDLLGKDDEGTVDSSHPTDLGFMRQAEAFHRLLGPLLSK